MNAGNASFSLDENSAEDFRTEIIPENPSFTCKKCQMDYVEGENCIQCQDCKTWLHYNCSMLPPYQLFLYESTQRKFTCEFCTDMDEEYEPSYKSQSEKETKNQTDIMNDKFVVEDNKRQNKEPKIMTNPSGQEEIMRKTTHIQHESISCQTEESLKTTNTCIQRKSISCQTEEPLKTINTGIQLESISCQTEEPLKTTNIQHESISCQTEEPFYDFETFKTSSVTFLQESFVCAFDKVNDSIRTMKANQSKELEMKQRITVLTKENKKLKENNNTDAKYWKCE